MAAGFIPVAKRTLADDLAHQIKRLIDSGEYRPGDRLPPIAEMARRFEVGSPTLREALKRLEAGGVVTVRHGSGIYVAANHDSLFITNPVRSESPSKQMLLDLLEARVAIEVKSVSLAAVRASAGQVAEMEDLLVQAGLHIDEDDVLNATNMAFHQKIAEASGNVVIKQVLTAFSDVFKSEQQAILRIHGSRLRDHAEHLAILEAIRVRDAELAADRMRAHIEGVRAVILRWEPEAVSASLA